MRVVFIHGINNQRNLISTISNKWRDSLQDGRSRRGQSPITFEDISVGYYAQRLYYATHGKRFEIDDTNQELPIFPDDAQIAQGGASSAKSGDFSEGLLQEYASAYEIEMPTSNVQGIRDRLVDLVDAIQDRLPPGVSKAFAKPFLRQAATWASSDGLRNVIEQQVANIIVGERNSGKTFQGFGSDPMIIIAHSLGCAVAYRMLLNPSILGDTEVPLFVTLGSALPVKFIRRGLDKAHVACPNNVKRWVNLYDKRDFVPTGAKTRASEIGFLNVENFEGVEFEGEEDVHSIAAHLRHEAVSEAVNSALDM